LVSPPRLAVMAGRGFGGKNPNMTLAQISELFAEGKTNTDIGRMMVEEGTEGSAEMARKGVGFLRGILENGNSAEAMMLTKMVQDGSGRTLSSTYARRSLQDETIPEHLEVERLTTAPGGGQWRKYKSTIDSAAILKAELLKEIKPLNIEYTTPDPAGDLALEIMLTDHHFGKIPFSYKEEDWTLANAKREYLDAVAYHISQAPKEVSTLILPIGNDLLHINSNTGTTKKGTAMEYSANYHRLYSFVRDVVAGSVVSLSERFNIKIVVVPGNHDEDACYRLGDYLMGLFDGSQRVTVDNSGHDRKYVEWGNTLLMFTHGEKVNIQKLHDSFSSDVPSLNGRCKYRYAHIGHLHKNMKSETWRKNIKDEYLGTEVEICPSLSPTDNWHFDNMYVGNQRRTKAFLYSLDRGKVSEWYYSI
jgi:predicted phosphodiesterase